METVLRLAGESLPAEGGFYPHTMTLNVSGVGTNVARALHALGSSVRLLTVAAEDTAGMVIRQTLQGIDTHFTPAQATPQSLALIRPDGTHTYYRDLKDTPEQIAPRAEFQAALEGCAAVLLGNIGWTRDLLPLARQAGIPVITDAQDISGLDDAYHQPYFQGAEVLLFSAARLNQPIQTLLALPQRSAAQLFIATLGDRGALLLERHSRTIHHQRAFPVQAVFHGGAGDALAGAFAHFYFVRGESARESLRLACAAAALKLRTLGSGVGHASEEDVRLVAAQVK